ncbi:Phage regulatory protein, Rha family [Weissella ceti]|uniref:Rha family transcriptional regulator n=1 Tax=Weissella ceti TaxID=759620 RepID=UPI0004F5D6A6|nr:Rha family transcriptional regulator [Weissella ceti]AIM64248.1 Phage regulatory protein, Rha family [Weissella ceti]
MQEIVQIENNEVMTTSRQIAEVFGKRHDKVIDSVRGLIEKLNDLEHTPNLGGALKIEETTYLDGNGRERIEFNLNKNAMILTVMSYQTKKALKFKLAYIEQFDLMEEHIRNQQLPDTEHNEALLQWFDRALKINDNKLAGLLLVEAVTNLTQTPPPLPDPLEKYYMPSYQVADILNVTPALVQLLSNTLGYTDQDGMLAVKGTQVYYSDEGLAELRMHLKNRR